MVIVAGRFPIELSRQARASLYTVPIFMATLLLHPAEAAGVAIVGTLITEFLLNAPARAMAFNTGVAGVSAASAGMVFYGLMPDGATISLTAGPIMAAIVTGAVLHVVNVGMVAGMVTIRKGMGYWKPWDRAYALETVQEGGMLALGLTAAVLVAEVWWSLFIILIPTVMAYAALRWSLQAASEKARLAEELETRLKELRDLQAQLIQSAKMASVGTLAAGVAHEINNPVFAIAGRAELMLKNPEKHLKSDKAKEYVETIQDMSQRISSIVRRLLEHARATDEVKDIQLAEVIEDSLALVSSRLSKSSVRVLRDYGQVPTIRGIRPQLQQVFVNLLTNAIDATNGNGNITVGCSANDGIVKAYVRDDGSGIPEAIRDRLFEPFFTTKEVGKGTGLGLFICHKIVSAHKGEIKIDSQENKGTTIWLSIPVAAQIDEETMDMSPEPERVAVGSGQR
jgi:signal transduction histidine kinase